MIGKNNTQETMEFFFKNPTREVYLRELSRELNLSMPTILAAIEKLRKVQLVIVTKEKAFTNVKANLENKNFFRLKRLSNIEQLYVCGVIDTLEITHPQSIICFGSYSRGEDVETSDIDIAIIGGNEKDIALEKFEKELQRKISLHWINPSRISNDFKANLMNGIVLEGAL